MKVTQSVTIAANRQSVWQAISNIENSASIISGIKKIEVLSRPSDTDITGLRWRETREMFGKDAVEEMWIEHATENEGYTVCAENHGAQYVSTFALSGDDQQTTLTMDFEGRPVTTGARVMMLLTGWMMKKPMEKTLAQDLTDIKQHLESQGG